MKQDCKCFLGSHKYTIVKEEPVKLAGTDIEVGKAIISECSNCGKIKVTTVDLVAYGY